MSDAWIFIWGFVVFALAVGPLTLAAALDLRERGHKRELERAAGLHQDQSQ